MPIPAVAEFVPVGLVEVSDEVGFREPLEEVSVPEEAGDLRCNGVDQNLAPRASMQPLT